MALSGLEIYKLLPKTNCKECGFPTCLAFAMKLAAKQAELVACPYVSEEARASLAAAAAPPIRLITISSDGRKIEAGNETVMFRHEKTFYHEPGLLVRVKDTQPLEEFEEVVAKAASYSVERVGMELSASGFAVENASGDAALFVGRIEALKAIILAQQEQNARLEAMVAAFRQAMFGRKSEKLDADQLNLALEDLEAAAASVEAEQEQADATVKERRTKERRRNRGHLPEHLPREEVIIEPEDKDCPCCGGALHVIGEDVSERLDRIL